MIATYYERIHVARLAVLLGLAASEVEGYLSKLVVSKTIYARIDRPAGVVTFVPQRDPNDVLNAWGQSISQLLHLVERSTHLIAKEEMVHKIIAHN